MIGISAKAEDRDIASEFFELFKTPWEFCQRDRRYDVVIDAGGMVESYTGRVVIIYGSQQIMDRDEKPADRQRQRPTLSHHGSRIPLYGSCRTFAPGGDGSRLVLEDTGEPVVSVGSAQATVVIRIGYDLFREIGFLLTTGQPSAQAAIPTVERHIALLRDCILGAGVPLVEIPPSPDGYRFIVCLTHDVDHPSIRRHGLDHTVLGFLYRAVVGSLLRTCTGRMRPSALGRNMRAALLLPLVHLGRVKDFWSGFDEYLELERGLGSTFFVIPMRECPGRTLDGEAPRIRGAAYGASDIADSLNTATAAGSEVALHGIDAWLDSTAARAERDMIASVTGVPAAGVRMHWLFWNDRSPQRLEEAGFDYDSTFGYNETVGFRAGTAQAFKPITAHRLLEIPLTVMDTALFYPSYLNLTQETATRTVGPLVDEVERHGGALTVNWHDRSLAPERLWGGFYRELVDDLKRRAAWFPTTAQAAAWFRQRRSVVFDSVSREGNSMRVRVSAEASAGLPGLTVRVHTSAASFTDVAFKDTLDTKVPL